MSLKIKIFSVITVILLIVSAISFTTFAGSKIEEEVSLLNVRQNVHGNGYEWDNPDDTLTLDNLYIDTDDEYGMKLPDGCTVILKGVNRITASKAALYLGGDVTFKGTGTLILNGGEYGIMCNCTDKRSKLSIIGGKYEISAGDSGIYSAIESISLSTADIKITADKYAVYGQTVTLTNGLTLTSENAPIYAAVSLTVDGCNIKVAASSSALQSDGELKTENMSYKVGSALSSLASADSYNSENAVSTESQWHDMTTSFLFGENVSVIADVFVFIGIIALIVAAIVVPKLLKKKKLAKINAAAGKKA